MGSTGGGGGTGDRRHSNLFEQGDNKRKIYEGYVPGLSEPENASARIQSQSSKPKTSSAYVEPEKFTRELDDIDSITDWPAYFADPARPIHIVYSVHLESELQNSIIGYSFSTQHFRNYSFTAYYHLYVPGVGVVTSQAMPMQFTAGQHEPQYQETPGHFYALFPLDLSKLRERYYPQGAMVLITSAPNIVNFKTLLGGKTISGAFALPLLSSVTNVSISQPDDINANQPRRNDTDSRWEFQVRFRLLSHFSSVLTSDVILYPRIQLYTTVTDPPITRLSVKDTAIGNTDNSFITFHAPGGNVDSASHYEDYVVQVYVPYDSGILPDVSYIPTIEFSLTDDLAATRREDLRRPWWIGISSEAVLFPPPASSDVTLALHYGSFIDDYGDGDVITAASRGRFYANTPVGSYPPWGTIHTIADIGFSRTQYTISFDTAGLADVLLVGGGGAGGYTWHGGGGGGGGVVLGTQKYLEAGPISTYTFEVGRGATSYENGIFTGTNLSGLPSGVAFGGGKGGNDVTRTGGFLGGSGGGAEGYSGQSGGPAQIGQGYAGGNAIVGRLPGGLTNIGGGGGGASAVGANEDAGGHGGAGIDVSEIFGVTYGDAGRFGGGGGGGGFSTVGGNGGVGGGGRGANHDVYDAANGTRNTGGGGGGAGVSGRNGGFGGSGIALIKYLPIGSAAGLLDAHIATTYSDTNGAYSVRKLYYSYNVAQIRIRRSVDDVEQDWAFDKDGMNPDYESWLGGSTAYVVTWYDQSGNNNHGTASAADAVTFDYATKQLLFGPTGYFILPDATCPINNDPYTFVAYHGSTPNIGGTLVGSGTMANNQANTWRRSWGAYHNFWWNNDKGGGSYRENQVAVARYNGTHRNIYTPVDGNGSEQASAPRASTAERNLIGWFYGNEYWQGGMYTVIIYKSALAYDTLTDISNLLVS